MTQFYNSLNGLISSEMVNKVAKTVEEKPENVQKAISMIIPSLLALYLKTHNPNVNNIVREAGNLNLLNAVDDICNEDLTADRARLSDNFLQEMVGDRAASLTAPIADHAGISKVAANQLIYMMSALVVAYLGERFKKDKLSETQLLDEIRKAKPDFAAKVPAEVVSAFDLAYILRTGSSNSVNVEEKKSNRWLVWLIAVLALLLLLFFLWRSCKDEIRTETVGVTQTISSEVNKAVEEVKDMEFVDINLPDGKSIHVKRGSIEDKMIRFLNSDEYKTASNDELKKKWFEFENVDFEFNSSDKLISGAEEEIDNIAAILKSYKDTKVEIAGFADKKGTDEVNMNISQQRAKTIESILEKKGLTSQIVKTEGLGEKYAEHSESETNDQRAQDRDFALRFVKH